MSQTKVEVSLICDAAAMAADASKDGQEVGGMVAVFDDTEEVISIINPETDEVICFQYY